MKMNVLKALFGWEKTYLSFLSSLYKNLTKGAFLIPCRTAGLFKLLLVSFFN